MRDAPKNVRLQPPTLSGRPFFILSLDGGGSLGAYTLGVLLEIEQLLKCPIGTKFDLIYGTSTGAIISSMIALGEHSQKVWNRYRELAPEVMGQRSSRRRTDALRRHADQIFSNTGFAQFGPMVGVVAQNLSHNTPIIFKSDREQLRSGRASFEPGLGCSIADALMASCAAFPFFRTAHITTSQHGPIEAVDGGFMANNPTILALADAIGPLSISRTNIRVLSVGTGQYPEKRANLRMRLATACRTSRRVMALLQISTRTMEWLNSVLFEDVRLLRINDAFTKDEYRTNFLESDPARLERIHFLGKQSATKREQEIAQFFAVETEPGPLVRS